MADAAKHKFVKLNDSNYANWKFRMELLLRKQNLWKKVMVDGKPQRALNANGRIENQSDIDKWDELDDMARGTLVWQIRQRNHGTH